MTFSASGDPIGDYFAALQAEAEARVRRHQSAVDLMERGSESFSLPALLALRRPLLTEQDRLGVLGYLECDCFTQMIEVERIAAFVICRELDELIEKLDLDVRFEAYRDDHPLFLQCPGLVKAARNAELIAASSFKRFGMNGLVEADGGWGRLDPFLDMATVQWIQGSFREAPLFVRLDPSFASASRPDEPLMKAVVRPLRPDWCSTVALADRDRDGAHHVLEPGPPGTPGFYEYSIRGVRTLEVSARRHKGNLTAMIEELSFETPKFLLGRCIHLDTDAVVGTRAGDAVLNHLDMAINVYRGGAMDKRLACRLSDGKVEDASIRTHLLRVERVPFASVPQFAGSFLRSSVLLEEWITTASFCS